MRFGPKITVKKSVFDGAAATVTGEAEARAWVEAARAALETDENG